MLNKEQRRDLYYQKKYGITLVEYNAFFDEQAGVCSICGHPPGRLPLSVDHDHRYKRVKIKATRITMPHVIGYPDTYGNWEATATYRGQHYTAQAPMKFEAVRKVRAQLKKASVRGLLCWLCNTGLRKFAHDALRILEAAAYLKRWAGETA